MLNRPKSNYKIAIFRGSGSISNGLRIQADLIKILNLLTPASIICFYLLVGEVDLENEAGEEAMTDGSDAPHPTKRDPPLTIAKIKILKSLSPSAQEIFSK